MLTVVWEATKEVRDADVPTSALEATIVSRTSTKLTAVHMDDAEYGVVHMYSLYTNKVLVFFQGEHQYHTPSCCMQAASLDTPGSARWL